MPGFKSQIFIFSTLLLSASAYGRAGPPLITDDPNTPGPNRWEINLALTSDVERGEKLYDVPFIDANYGWGEKIQLKYEVPWLIAEDDQNHTETRGFDRSNLGVKWRFQDKDAFGVALSTYPQFAMPSPAANSVSDREGSLFLPLEAEESSAKFEFNQEIGLQLQGGSNQLVYGLAVTYVFSPSFALLGELHGATLIGHSDSEILYNLGFDLTFNPTFDLLFAAGKTIQDFTTSMSHHTIGYIALQIHI